ncbi:hypothetical protein JCM3770_004137 [Rhodotorula araucariae]
MATGIPPPALLDPASVAPASPAQPDPARLAPSPAGSAVGDRPTVACNAAPSATPTRRFSLDLFRRPHTRSVHPEHDDAERPIGHQARVLYALITGSIPPAPPSPRKPSISVVCKTAGRSPRPMAGVLSLATLAEPALSMEKARGARARKGMEEKCRPVPHVKPKTLKKLKADLVNADKARAIVADLHRMDVPLDDSSGPAIPLGGTPAATPKRRVSRGYALPPLDTAETPSPIQPTDIGSAADNGDAEIPLLSFGTGLPPTSPGALGGLAAAKSGAFEILADVTGALIEKSGAHDGVYAVPQDRVSVFVYWWGFEICLPPPAIRTLSSVASVQSSIFTFLQAFVLAGGISLRISGAHVPQLNSAHVATAGAPELAPFVRYISSYCDIEWQAIKAQNKGSGAVLAATWLLPVALVPRAWDFPVRRAPPAQPVKPT